MRLNCFLKEKDVDQVIELAKAKIGTFLLIEHKENVVCKCKNCPKAKPVYLGRFQIGVNSDQYGSFLIGDRLYKPRCKNCDHPVFSGPRHFHTTEDAKIWWKNLEVDATLIATRTDNILYGEELPL